MLPAFFAFVIFWIRSHIFAQACLTQRSSYLHLQHSWDYRYEPPCRIYLCSSLTLPKVTSNCNLLGLHLQSTWDYGHVALWPVCLASFAQIVLLRFIHVVDMYQRFFPFIWVVLHHINMSLFIPSAVVSVQVAFQFVVVMNKAAVNILVAFIFIFLCKYLRIHNYRVVGKFVYKIQPDFFQGDPTLLWAVCRESFALSLWPRRALSVLSILTSWCGKIAPRCGFNLYFPAA
jgi:hypothetical protein